MNIFLILKEAKDIVVRRQKEKRLKQELYDIAKQFNNRHTYTGDGLWMCPICNKVYNSTGFNVLTGMQYPACCHFTEGHRLFFTLHATTMRLKT